MRRTPLDEQLPRALARELGAGVECVQDRGWAGLTDAVAKVQALALRALAERMEAGEAVPELLTVSFLAA